MIIVSGLRRTGTSLMMNILKEAGFDAYAALFSHETWESKLKELNPNGFFESAFRDSGVNPIQMEFSPKEVEYTAIKVFASAIPRCDGEYITKQIIMLRDFSEVYKSQERMKELDEKKELDSKEDIFEPGETYLLDYYCVLRDIVKRNKPTLFIDYYDVMQKKDEVLGTLRRFIGCGRFDLAYNLIDDKLYRNRKEKINILQTDLTKYLDLFYNQMKNGTIFERNNYAYLEQMANSILEKAKIRNNYNDKGEKNG